MSSNKEAGDFSRILGHVGNVSELGGITDRTSGDVPAVPFASLLHPTSSSTESSLRFKKTSRIINPSTPSPEENPEISKPQRLTAQIVYSATVLDRLASLAKEELPGLKTRSVYQGENSEQTSSDRDIVINRVSGLLSAFRLHSSAEEGTIDKADLDRFHGTWEDSDDLLRRSKEVFDSLEETREEIYEKAAHTGSWKQRRQRFGAKVKTRMKLGSDREMLYDLTDTTMGQEQEKSRAWTRTLAASILSEVGPHVGGATAAIADLPKYLADTIPGIDSTPGRFLTAAALNAAMLYLVFGPNTKENTDMIMDGGTSTTPVAKLMHESATEYGEVNEEEARERAKLGHWYNQAAWEAVYAAETMLLGLTAGPNAAIDYWGGSAAVALAKNSALLALFKGRKGVKSWRKSRELQPETMDAPRSGDLTPGSAIRLMNASQEM